MNTPSSKHKVYYYANVPEAASDYTNDELSKGTRSGVVMIDGKIKRYQIDALNGVPTNIHGVVKKVILVDPN